MAPPDSTTERSLDEEVLQTIGEENMSLLRSLIHNEVSTTGREELLKMIDEVQAEIVRERVAMKEPKAGDSTEEKKEEKKDDQNIPR
ncbi:hypothetical protein MBLNU459_g4168t1 [Dothideomycetes sp. NU459]